MIEEWKSIINFPMYNVSSDGRIRNIIRDRIVKQYMGKCGYYIVRLYNQGVGKIWHVHNLVARAFLTQPFCCSTCGTNFDINHKDHNPQNNNAFNLEYVTRSQNVLKSSEKQKHASREWYKKSLWSTKKVTNL